MNNDTANKVISILARRSRVSADSIDRSTRFVEDLKLDGDDAIDAILEISKKLDIDLAGFDGSVHFRSEPSLLSLFRRKAVPEKPAFTVGELLDAVDRGALGAR